jgi:hypothetical protein
MERLTTVLQNPRKAPRLLPFKRGCEYAGFGTTKMYELIAEEKIIAYKDGQRTFLDLDSIDTYKRSLPRMVGRRAKRHRRT